MGVAEALWDMAVAALVAVVAAIVWAEVLHGRADRRYAEELRECGRAAGERAARVRADRVKAQAVADYGFDLAEQQLARHRALPSREQVRADVSAVTGGHDRIKDIPALELLAFAAIVDGLRERPATPVDSEQAGGPLQW